VKELRRNFAFLALTEFDSINPYLLIQKITDEKGYPISIGNQEDITGFFFFF
jgi:hypothetical protein